MIEQLRIGARVFSSDGKQVGSLSRIVVAGAEPVVTHLVVDPAMQLSDLLEPGSLDTSHDRTVPVALARQIDDEGVILTCTVEEFAKLPLFERRLYVDAPIEPGSSRFRMGDLVNYLASAFGLGAAPYLSESEEVTFNVATGASVIPDDAPVWRNTPHEEIGEVEQTLVDTTTQRVTGLVVRRHSIDEQLVVIPIEAITSLEDGVAHVELTDEELDQLAPYEGDES